MSEEEKKQHKPCKTCTAAIMAAKKEYKDKYLKLVAKFENYKKHHENKRFIKEGEVEMERTLSIVKPDAVKRGLIGSIVHRIEKSMPEIKIVDMFKFRMTKKNAEAFYNVHEGRHFFKRLIDFMSSGPCVILLLEGKNVICHWRTIMGSTDCKKAIAGSIRRDHRVSGVPMHENMVHGSDSVESAEYEINCFFGQQI